MDANQKAFQEFILGGRKGASISSASTISPKSDPQPKRKKKKQFGPIFKAIQGRIEEWKDLDGQLEAVLGSIANLRDRLWWENNQLTKQERPTKEWEGFGFRERSNTTLTVDDMEMALSHDLLQHEKMLSGARTLMASMAQEQDGMGRRLDEWMLLHLEEEPMIEVKEVKDLVQEAYLLLAEELYRKQMILEEILDSCRDGLVSRESVGSVDVGGEPREIARKCCGKWRSGQQAKDRWLLIDDLLSMDSLNCNLKKERDE